MSNEQLLWLNNYLTEIYKTPMLENFLNLQIAEIGKGKIKYSTKVIDQFCNMYGSIHGGTLASIADVAMGVSCFTLGKKVVTIDMNISYLKNVPSGNTIIAVGKVINNGRTIMRAAGEIYDDKDQLLIRSQASYFVTGEFSEEEFKKII